MADHGGGGGVPGRGSVFGSGRRGCNVAVKGGGCYARVGSLRMDGSGREIEEEGGW